MDSPIDVSDKGSTENATPDNTGENARSSVQRAKKKGKKKVLASDKAEIKRYSTQ